MKKEEHKNAAWQCLAQPFLHHSIHVLFLKHHRESSMLIHREYLRINKMLFIHVLNWCSSLPYVNSRPLEACLLLVWVRKTVSKDLKEKT